GNGRWRRFPACSPSSELQPVVEKLLQSAAEGRGLNPAVNRNMERKMEILFSPSSAGPKTRPPGVSVAVHLVELGRFVERADLRDELSDADWERAAQIPSLPRRMAFMAGRRLPGGFLGGRV